MFSIRLALLGSAALLAIGSASASAQTAGGTTTVSSSQQVEFDIILPLQNATALDTLLAQQQNPASPFYHHWLTPAQFGIQFGANPGLKQRVASILQASGFQTTIQSRSIHVLGNAGSVTSLFNTVLAIGTTTTGKKRLVAASPLTLPTPLSAAGAIVSAFSARGFDSAPFARQSSAGYARQSSAGYGQPANATVPTMGFFYNTLKQAYGYPSYQTTTTVNGQTQRLDGTGATVAVLMASDVLDSDVSALFSSQSFVTNSGQPANPAIYARRTVNGGAAFSTSNNASEEATLDVEQVLGGAPGAHLVLYNTPDLSDQSLISGYTAIVNDNTADIVSMSFGQCESYYTAAYNGGQDQTPLLNLFSELFKQGNAQGITFVAASGDAGGLACLSTSYFSGGAGQFVAGVATPAADPNVTAVGGSNLVAAASTGGSSSSYLTENAWSDPEIAFDPFAIGVNATGGVWGAGGGVSTLYPKPSYQSLVSTGSVSFRTVPDVGMEMGGCPDVAQTPCNGGNAAFNGSGNTDRSSLNVVFNGVWDNIVGTSAAAPEMASAIALLVETQGRQGNLNPYLYKLAQGQAAAGTAYFHQSLPGFNGMVANSTTYNFTVGNGTPYVAAMIGLPNASPAGAPQSATNP